ncbi:MAG: hypothetical protein DI536_05950 [Archangium gephyra]|uniref:Uncharacterized protein n=1 Tax=Archangium gephyra TaxID=48 RepID=A0A2W5TRZ6_9BACT|nr:MAG: hypothetical protein DI536_05950 [Archangium gephyra]
MTHLLLPKVSAVPTPLELSSYLRATGWTWALRRGAFDVFKRNDDELEVPQIDSARDYVRLVGQLIDDLSKVEQRPPAVIARDVRASVVDTTRLALKGAEMRDGTISIAKATAAHDGTRNLILAAACSVLDRRLVHPKRKPDKALEVLKTTRLGQSEMSSFVITLETPVAPRLQLQSDFFEGDDAPIERRTTLLLADALAATQEAALQTMALGSIDPFKQMAHRGVSANLCDAIAELLTETGAEFLDTSVSFAVHRPVARPPPTHTIFAASQATTLTEVARVLRAETPLPNQELIGLVVALDSGNTDKGGTFWLVVDLEGRLRRVGVKVGADDYHRAVEAHDKGQLLSVSGDLVSKAGKLSLERSHDLSTLELD